MTTTILIDADTAAYTAALGAEYTHEWEGGVISRGADTNKAIEGFESYVAHMIEVHKATDHRLALTDVDNFRKTILPTYKSKRSPKPIALAAVRKHAIENMGAIIKPGLEADDIVGIWSTHPSLIKGRKVIVSVDKDLRSVPGLLSKGDGKVETITGPVANYMHLSQTLTGDIVDGYTGLPGCGPKGASKILQALVDDKGGLNSVLAWHAVVDAYVAKGLTEADALVQARVARILRYTDYNFKTKEPILWTPPSTP